MKDHITKLCDYGQAFLGLYCVVVGCSLKWKQGGAWMFMDMYDSVKDEHCKLFYNLQTRPAAAAL